MRVLLLSTMVACLALGCGPSFKTDDLVGGAGGAGAGGAAGGTGGVSPEAVPDFKLMDVNPTSPRFGDAVSPRDYLHQVSAWYFGNST